MPIALLYYSTNVIAVLCAGQLILRTRDSFPHTQGERERERERERKRERERGFALVRDIPMESTLR